MPPDKLTVHDLPDSEKPRERLAQYGAAALSNAELLAIILGTGTRHENVVSLSTRTLAHFDGLGGLSRATQAELNQINGLGKAKISQILAMFEIGRRLMTLQAETRPLIQTSAEAARLVWDMNNLQQEQIRVILLDASSRVLAMPTIYQGTVNMAVVRIAEIYREAISRNAPAMILVHNHPSGDTTPSPEDVQLTQRILEAGDLLDIILLDHLIIGGYEWRSLKQMRLGF